MEAAEIETQPINTKKLQSINNLVVSLRAEAIRMRQETRIEQVWREDEAAYEANYLDLDEWQSKPPGQQFVGTDNSKSKIGYNITAPYCDTGSASMGDMLFPTDDKPWSLDPTTVPEIIELAKGQIPLDIQKDVEAEVPNPEDIFAQAIEKAKIDYEKAKKITRMAENRIQDWHDECQFVSHCRDVLDDCAKVGTGVLKGPFPTLKKKAVFVDGKIQIKETLQPASRRISYWNAFPDLNAGQDIHQGSYFFERDDITRRELEDLKGQDYIDSEIDAAIREGAYKATGAMKGYDSMQSMGMIEKKGTFEIWYGYMRLDQYLLEEAGLPIKNDGVITDIHITMVNGRIIKAIRNPMELGQFPYDIMVWKRRKGIPFGIGVSREIRMAQRMVDAAIRNLMSNAGIAGGPMLAFIKGVARPMNGKAEIKPLKLWEIDPTKLQGVTRIDQVISYIKIDMVQQELERIIDRGLKMAEDITGLPMLLQGQQGAAPDTVGGMTILTNNATAFRRRIARLFDSLLTTPHVRRYYDFLLQYGRDEEKGDVMIVAKGSSALVERDIQAQALLPMINLFASNPTYKKDPAKLADEYLKSQKFDPRQFDYDDEQWEQLVQQILSAGQSDSRIQVEQLKQEGKQIELQFKAQMAEREQQFEAQMKEMDRQYEMAIKQIDIENEQRKEAGKAELTAAEIQRKLQEARDKINSDIAQTAMKLDTQVKLSGTEVLTPPVEPRGRAEPGRSFEQ